MIALTLKRYPPGYLESVFEFCHQLSLPQLPSRKEEISENAGGE